MAGLVVAGLTTWQYEGTTAKKKHEHRISYLTGGGLLMEGLEAPPHREKQPSVLAPTKPTRSPRESAILPLPSRAPRWSGTWHPSIEVCNNRGRCLLMSNNCFDSDEPGIFEIATRAAGPRGSLPLTGSMLRELPSGDLFGWTQNAGMGWNPLELGGKEFLILSTHGGVRAPDGSPVALGYHTGHWEVGLLVEAAARELKAAGPIPFAGCCTDPCDGRSQGTPAMFDSLPYRNDAATVFRRLIRSLPTRRGVLGIATCDKGLPAMMMALAAMRDLPSVLVPGGVTLLPAEGEDAAAIQSIGARYVHGELTLEQAADLGCRACASPGGGCQFLGTAATSQVVAEALGMALGHAALAPSGHAIWLDMARRSARALMALERRGIGMREILTEAALHNAMVTHAAFGGATNLALHVPAIAHAAGLPRP